MALSNRERSDLRALSRLHEDSQTVPAMVLERDDGRFHYAFLMDDFRQTLKTQRNGKNGTTHGNTTNTITGNGQDQSGPESSPGKD